MNEEKPTPSPKAKSTEWQHASWVSTLGKWAWIIGIIGGLIDILWGLSTVIYWLPFLSYLGFTFALVTPIWLIISGIIAILISLAIVKPKISNPCAKKDWDYFYNWVWKLGSFRFPFVLFWGIILEIFGYGWAGLPIILVAIMLIFLGPKEYRWSE